MTNGCKNWFYWARKISRTGFVSLKTWPVGLVKMLWKWRCRTNVNWMEVSTYLAIIIFVGTFVKIVIRSSEDARVETAIAKLEEIASAVSVYRNNTACVPNKLSVLFSKRMASAANNFCGADTTARYGNHVYLLPMPTDGGAGVLLLRAGFSSIRILIRRNLLGTASRNYALEVYHFGGALYPVLSACNGVDYSAVPIWRLPHDFSKGVGCVYVMAHNSLGMLIFKD